MTISFFGHRDFVDNKEVYAKIFQELLELVKKEEKLICYCGGYGGFDRFCEKILLDLKKQYNKIVLCYVTPYLNEKYLKNIRKERYEEIIFPPIEKALSKFAIIKRNEWIIEQSDLIFVFCLRSFGGAYNALNFAKRKNKKIIELKSFIK